MKKQIVTVIGSDSPGILAAVLATVHVRGDRRGGRAGVSVAGRQTGAGCLWRRRRVGAGRGGGRGQYVCCAPKR